MCILYVQVASSDTVERQGEGGKEETGGKARVFMKILGDPEPEREARARLKINAIYRRAQVRSDDDHTAEQKRTR